MFVRVIHRSEAGAPQWLLLTFQLPARPSRLRVKCWRRLQSLGALLWVNSAWVLPASERTREDFEWLKSEIAAARGRASVFAATALDEASDAELQNAFREARRLDFEAIRNDAGRLLGEIRRAPSAAAVRQRWPRQLRQLRNRLEQAESIDYFAAPGRREALAALAAIAEKLSAHKEAPMTTAVGGKTRPAPRTDYRRRIWITRPRPGVDRMSSAWLIRKFIDPHARFRFAEKPESARRTVAFDMFGGDFTHEGDGCTFETLVRRFAIRDQNVAWLAKIIHQVDLKDDRDPVAEAPAVHAMVEGLRRSYSEDSELLEQGIIFFEALYRSRAAGAVRGRKN